MNKDDKVSTLSEVKSTIERIGKELGARKEDLPTIGHSVDFACPCVQIEEGRYIYSVAERGKELRRRVTEEIEELLLWVFEDVSFSIASRTQTALVETRVDPRRSFFAQQLNLLKKVNAEWANLVEKKQSKIIRDNPYDDFTRIRAKYCKELRDNGTPDDVAWNNACKKYPLP